MRRREFIALLGAGSLVSYIARAQHPTGMPLLGILSASRERDQYLWARFVGSLLALGWDEDRNIRIVRRGPDRGAEEMPELAQELVAQGATVLFAAAGNPAIRAAQKATSSLPIIGMTDDMVGSGLVASLARPGGNTTGVSILASELNVKRLELLHEFLPNTILADPTSVSSRTQLENAARELNIELLFYSATSREEIHAEIIKIAERNVQAVNVLASPILNDGRALIIEAAAEAGIPAIYQWPETAEEGGLIGYGPRWALCIRHASVLIDKVLRGGKPADLPVEQPNVFTLAINLKTAKRLRLAIPPGLLLRADELVE
jgi:putative ABC transport system substrate-binding protein